MTLEEITLLSADEYCKYDSVIPDIDAPWRMRSPGEYFDQEELSVDDTHFTCGSHPHLPWGGSLESACHITDSNYGIRPAIKLSIESSDNLSKAEQKDLVGTKIEYGNCQWTVLDASSNEVYALCDEIIAQRQFDPKTNVWENSELKGWLETKGLELITEDRSKESLNDIDKKPLENEVCKAFKEYIQSSNDPSLEAIKQHISEEKPISAFSIPSMIYGDVAKTFAENNIPYSAFSDTAPQADQPGTCLLFVRDSDSEKAKAVFEELLPSEEKFESLDELIENIDTNNSTDTSEPFNAETVETELC